MKFTHVVFVVLFVVTLFSNGQETKDTVLLSPFQVSAEKEIFSLISENDSLSSLSVSLSSVTEQIRMYSPVFIKEKSPGGIATLAFRGTSASHTIVLFDGFPVNPAMTGQADFSSMPPFLYDRLEMTGNPESLLLNPHAIGGIVAMNTDPVAENNSEIRLRYETGSFGLIGGGLHLHHKTGRFFFRFRGFLQSADNDFPFINNSDPDWPVERRVNAGFEKKGFMQEAFFIDSKQVAFFKITGVNNMNELPSGLLQPQIDENETFTNTVLRFTGGYTMIKGKQMISVKGLYSNENWEYVNLSVGTEGINTVTTVSAIADWKYMFNEDRTVKLQWFSEYQLADSPNYTINPEILTNRMTASGYLEMENIQVKPAIHLIKKDQNDMGLSGVMVLGRKFLKDKIHLNISGGRSIHYPGMNDLYWFPGGNSNLLPEISLSGSAVVEFRPLKWWAFSAGITALDVDNWIVWQPVAGSSVWTPVNIRKVSSVSYDFLQMVHFTVFSTEIKSIVSYSYCLSLDKSDQETETYKKQLIYVPMHNCSHQLQLTYRTIQLRIFSQYTGKRFTRADNLSYMPAHFCHDVNLAWKKNLLHGSIELFAGIYNFTAENYQIIAWQPMPRRYLRVGIQVRFHEKKF